jgi:superfamily I DNA/RNA helicase
LDPTLSHKYSKFQHRAVTQSPFTNVVIRAGPGTGKTTTLKWRVQNFIKRGIPPQSILALSFTREAQDGLRRKVDIEMKWKDMTRPTFKTFHALALMVVRAVAKFAPVCQFGSKKRSFDIIADSESKVFVAEAIQQFNENDALVKRLRTMNLFARQSGQIQTFDADSNITAAVVNVVGGGGGGGGGGRDRFKKHKPRQFSPRIPPLPTDGEYVVGMKKWIRSQKNRGITAQHLESDKSLWDEQDDAQCADLKARQDLRRRALIYARYQQLLDDHDYLDIEDLCPGLLSILQTHRSVVIQLQQWARFILVDEFQDLTPTQVHILEHLCGGGNTSATKTTSSFSYLTVCGDPDQSIYGFRGALGIRGFGVIERAFEQNKREHHREMYKCELLENRRSLPPIVNASNSLIAENYTEHSVAGRMGQQALQMKPLKNRRRTKGLVEVLTCKNVVIEVETVVAAIERIRSESAKKFKDFCILSRTNYGLKAYESALSKKNIPWRLVGSNRTSETAARNGTAGGGRMAGGGAAGDGRSRKRRRKGGTSSSSSSSSSALDQGVSLSTVHQAKGNEWPVVFVVSVRNPDDVAEELEEERRIFYVAMTRAKESLYVSWHRESNGNHNECSRFLHEANIIK